jgi:hypothetical protein
MDGKILGVVSTPVFVHPLDECWHMIVLFGERSISRPGCDVYDVYAGGDVGSIVIGIVMTPGEDIHGNAAIRQCTGEFAYVNVHASGFTLTRGSQRTRVISKQGDSR